MSTHDGNDINLAELVFAVWTHKFTVLAAQIACISVVLVYVFAIAPTLYEARSRFEMLDNGSSSQELGGLVSLIGIASQSGDQEANRLEDRILSRPFIKAILSDARFQNDDFFNGTHAETQKAISLRALLRSSTENGEREKDLVGGVLDALSKNLTVSLKKNGIVELTLTHTNAQRAAELVDLLVERSIDDIGVRARELSIARLNYFGDQLSEVQAKLDLANLALSEFAVTESLNSEQDLARASNQLTQLRANLKLKSDHLSVLKKLQSSEPGSFDGETLAQIFPVVFELEFRRYFDWGVDANSWNLPNRARLEALAKDLRAQKITIEKRISFLMSVATDRGRAALRLEELKREVKVQEVVYETMIRQFEAEALSSGFENSSARVIDPAAVPTEPVAPKKSKTLLIGVFAGTFIGIGLALLRGLRSGVLFSTSAIIHNSEISKTISAKLNVDPAQLRPLFGQKFRSGHVKFDDLAEVLIDCPNSMFLLPARFGQSDLHLVWALANQCATFLGVKVIVHDFTGSGKVFFGDETGPVIWKDHSDLAPKFSIDNLHEEFQRLTASNSFNVILSQDIQGAKLHSIGLAAYCDLNCILARAGALTIADLKRAEGLVCRKSQPQTSLFLA